MDEFERIAYLRSCFAPRDASASPVVLGIGDDAAVLSPGTGNLAISVDAAVQGVHFRLDYADWSTVGARAFSAALSDLAAMGAQPKAALMALIAPELKDEAFRLLIDGYAAASVRYRCPVIGGNLSRGSELSITTTVFGELHGAGVTRAGARVGDSIYVTGTLGDAALGLLLLDARRPELGRAFVERWQKPEARIAEGASLTGLASAAIDVSDGALQDLGHLCAASGVGAELRAAALPLSPNFAELARRLGREPVELALTGGEDYELIYTVPAGGAGGPGTCIGRIVEETAGITVRDANGRPLALQTRGYRHFQG
jgi:thiamine-monophosphate kinase